MISLLAFILFGLAHARDNFTRTDHTVRCNNLKVGETFKHDGKLFTKVNKTMLFDYLFYNKYTALETSCTSGLDDISGLFALDPNFNQDISKWDTSNVKNMKGMFTDSKMFNQDISKWNTSSVVDMSLMFFNAVVSLFLNASLQWFQLFPLCIFFRVRNNE